MRARTIASSEAMAADWVEVVSQSAVLFKEFDMGLMRFVKDYGAKVQR